MKDPVKCTCGVKLPRLVSVAGKSEVPMDPKTLEEIDKATKLLEEQGLTVTGSVPATKKVEVPLCEACAEKPGSTVASMPPYAIIAGTQLWLEELPGSGGIKQIKMTPGSQFVSDQEAVDYARHMAKHIRVYAEAVEHHDRDHADAERFLRGELLAARDPKRYAGGPPVEVMEGTGW